MFSKRNFQEFQFSVSDTRKKVDIQMMDSTDPQQRERGALQCESEINLRKSLAWDSAFFTSPGVLDPEELEMLGVQIVDDGVDTAEIREFRSLPSQTIGAETKSGVGQCSLRKSLAWDNAFSTSAGVLNAEELSLINGGFRPSETHLPPGCEEVCRSSYSTTNSDAYSLASLEIDLFENVRASKHKSQNAPSYRVTSTNKGRGEKERPRGYTLKISDASSQFRAAPRKGSKLSLKPPKISSRAHNLSAAPQKRVSLGANHVKMENKGSQATSGKCRKITSKKTCIQDSCSAITKLTPPVKSPSSVLPAASSSFTGKSSPNLLRSTIKSQLPASVSTSGTPLKYSAGNKYELMTCNNSTFLLSTPKSSSCTSSASSFDEWSAEPPSISLNPPKLSSFASNNHATTACRGNFFGKDTSQPSDSGRHRYDQPFLDIDTQETRLLNQQLNKIPVSTGLLPASVLKSSISSGLRMPSPKIGFFDAENSKDTAPNGGLKFNCGAQSTSSKIRSGISDADGASNRKRCGMNRLAGASSGTVSKMGTSGQVCLQEKKQPLKKHAVVRENCPENNVFDKDNKENIVSLENQIDDLSRHLKGIDFSQDLGHMLK